MTFNHLNSGHKNVLALGVSGFCIPSIYFFTLFDFQIKPEDDGSKSEDEDMAAIMAEFDLDNPFPGQSLPVSQQQQTQPTMPSR